MRKNLNVLILFALLLMSFNTVQAQQGYSLTVEVNELRNSEGVLQFTLYNKDGSIPDEEYRNYYKIQKVRIDNGASKAVFTDLPPGTYAVNILHDENKNGKIDKGFILPIEGIGFSRFETVGFSNRPNFRKASFNLNENKILRVKIIYM